MKNARSAIRIILAAAIMATPVVMSAQATIPVSGQKVVDNNLKPLTGQLLFTVTDSTNTPITYTPQGGSPTTATITIPVVNGAVQNVGGFPAQIPNPATMSPANSLYRLQVQTAGGGTTYFTFPLVSITQAFFSYDGYAVPAGVTASGMGLPKVPCYPHAQYNNTLASDPYPWVCSQFQGDSSVYWTQNPSLNPACPRGNDQAIASSLTGATFCVDASQAFVTPGFVWAGPTPGSHPAQIGLVPVTTLCAGGACGSGATPAAPQFAVQFAGPGAQAFNADSTFSFNTATHGLSALLTNGGYNSDVAATGSGNNGLANLEAGPCSAGGCTPLFPATSGSTESPIPVVSNTHVQDFRNGSQGDYFLNPAVGGGGGFNPGGNAFSAAHGLFGTWTTSVSNTALGQQQYGTSEFLTFKAPGFNIGTISSFGGPFWSFQAGHVINMTSATPGIAELYSGSITKSAVGDSAGIYVYNYSDGGYIEGAGEGTVGIGVGRYQTTAWFHATANAGSTTGSQLLFATYTPGSTSRPATSTGGYMLDVTRQAFSSTQVNFTGPSTQLSGYAAWTFAVDQAHTESTAWGTANAAIPAPANLTQYQTDTVSFTLGGGTNAGGYVPGFACLDGANLLDYVNITAVTTISAGVQNVTFSHLYPNNQIGTSLWQGGPCGEFVVPAVDYLNGWNAAYPILGAIDSTHLVGRFFTGNSQGSIGSALPIPNPYTASTVNVPLLSLSISGTTVTATFNGPAISVFAGLGSATISSATNSSFNGTAANITQVNTGQIQWTQSGPSGTSVSAQITIPANRFKFYEIPGAMVVQPQQAGGGIPLSPNNVAWTSGDHVENPVNPSYRGQGLSITDQIQSTGVQYNPGETNGLSISAGGAGISGGYHALTFGNNNAASTYQGGGGYLTPPTLMSFQGPTGTVLSTQYAPIDPYAPVILTGCVISNNCSTANNIRLWTVSGSGLMSYNPSRQEFIFNNELSARNRSPIISTGLGVSGTNPVAFTSGNSLLNDYVLGTYIALGNEQPLDTSGSLGATAYYGANFYAGGMQPTMNGVLIVGTPGSSSYSYESTCLTSAGEGLPTAAATTSTGNATLTASNYNALNVTPGKGCTGTNVYRTAAPGGYGLGLVCSNVPNNTINGGGCADTGQSAGATPPTSDTTGAFHMAVRDGCATWASGSLGSTGAACGSGGGGAVSSVFGRTGAVVAATNDYSFSQISGSLNLATQVTGTLAAGNVATLNQNTTGTAANLSGTPALPNGTTATTQTVGDNTTKLATDAFVLANAGGSSGFPITLGSTSVASSSTTTSVAGLTVDGVTPTTFGFVDPTSSIQTQMNAKAPLASPALTGTPTAPTATVGTNTTQVATTAFVLANGSSYTLPQATTSVLGGVKPDGTTCTTTAGVLTCPGSGGISGLTTGYIPMATSATAIGNSHMDDGITTAATITSTEPIVAPSFTGAGTTPGKFSLGAGTGSIPALAANSAGFAGPVTGGTAYLYKLPATAVAGILHVAAPGTVDGVNESAITSSPVSLTADVTGALPNANLANPSTTVNGVTCTLGSTCTVTASGIANITVTLPTSAITANTCTTPATATMTGLATTSTFTTAFATNPNAVAGWGSSGGLTFTAWPTANTLNWSVCNQTASSITPGAMTLNVGAR